MHKMMLTTKLSIEDYVKVMWFGSNCMRIAYAILILIVLNSCSAPEYKICEFETQDKELKIYHDVLTELIEQHFYNRYLRQLITKELAEKYPPIIDSSYAADFRRDLILLQNKLFNDTSKFETICYRPTLKLGPWGDFYSSSSDSSLKVEMDTTRQWRDLKALLGSVSQSWQSVADTIAKPQTKYTADSFRLCTSKVVQCGHFYESNIGVVSFSKAFLNDNGTKGILYYEFTCDTKCGLGEILLIEFADQRWTIKKVFNLWIS